LVTEPSASVNVETERHLASVDDHDAAELQVSRQGVDAGVVGIQHVDEGEGAQLEVVKHQLDGAGGRRIGVDQLDLVAVVARVRGGEVWGLDHSLVAGFTRYQPAVDCQMKRIIPSVVVSIDIIVYVWF